MGAFPRAESRIVVMGYCHLSRMGQGQKMYLAIMNEAALVHKAVKVRQVILKVISNLQKIRGSLTIRFHLFRVNEFREILIREGKGVIRLGGGGHRTGGDGGMSKCVLENDEDDCHCQARGSTNGDIG